MALQCSLVFDTTTNAVRCFSPTADDTLLIAIQTKVLSLLTKRWSTLLQAGASVSPSEEVLHRTSEAVYDAQFMSNIGTSATPAIAVACKHEAIKLFQASGAEIAQYRGYNALDEPMAAVALSVCSDSRLIAGGYNDATGHILMFDACKPGREPVTAMRTRRHRKCPRGQRGLLSTVAICPTSGGKIVAAGSFSGSTWLFDVRDGSAVASLKKKSTRGGGAAPGVTQLTWSPNDGGQFLYAGYRNAGATLHPGDDSDGILAWDVRRTDRPVCRYWRDCTSSQRIGFDLDASGAVLVTGSRDGRVLFYDTASAAPTAVVDGFPDAVNSVSLDPWGRFFAVSVGQRHNTAVLACTSDSDDDAVIEPLHRSDATHTSSGDGECFAGVGGVESTPGVNGVDQSQVVAATGWTSATASTAAVPTVESPTAVAAPRQYEVPDVWGKSVQLREDQLAGSAHAASTSASGSTASRLVEEAEPVAKALAPTACTSPVGASVTLWAWRSAAESSPAVTTPHT